MTTHEERVRIGKIAASDLSSVDQLRQIKSITTDCELEAERPEDPLCDYNCHLYTLDGHNDQSCLGHRAFLISYGTIGWPGFYKLHREGLIIPISSPETGDFVVPARESKLCALAQDFS